MLCAACLHNLALLNKPVVVGRSLSQTHNGIWAGKLRRSRGAEEQSSCFAAVCRHFFDFLVLSCTHNLLARAVQSAGSGSNSNVEASFWRICQMGGTIRPFATERVAQSDLYFENMVRISPRISMEQWTRRSNIQLGLHQHMTA